MTSFGGKRVLITGAAAGIGLECARSFARRGANLVLADTNAAALEQATREFTDLGVRCHAQVCDVASEASVAALAAATHAVFGPLDILVNNAGIGYLGRFEDTPVDWWRRTLDVNVIGIVHCIQAFLPAMRAAGGERRIVNVASLAGVAPAPSMSAYAASKFAVIGLSEVLALELDGSGISVTIVCPGIVNTDIVRAPGRTAASITDAQLDTLRRYYVDHGCLPNVVAERIVRGIEQDRAYVFVGPMARPASLLARVSRRITRRVTLRDARKVGYLE